MGVSASRVVVGDTPVVLNGLDTGGISGSAVAVKNMGTVDMFVGGPGVTPETGYPVPAGTDLAVDFESAVEALYGVVASGTTEVAVLRAGAA